MALEGSGRAACIAKAYPGPRLRLVARSRYRLFGRSNVTPGGSGQVGTILARSFHGGGHEVVVLSRRPQVRAWRVVPWTADRSAIGSARWTTVTS